MHFDFSSCSTHIIFFNECIISEWMWEQFAIIKLNQQFTLNQQ